MITLTFVQFFQYKTDLNGYISYRFVGKSIQVKQICPNRYIHKLLKEFKSNL